MIFNQFAAWFMALGSTAFRISRSIRLRKSASAYLSRVFFSPSNNTVWTFSVWVKRGSVGAYAGIFTAGTSGIEFNSSDQIGFYVLASAVATSTAVFRDSSAHSHLCFVSNGTTVTAYVNNQLVLTYTGTIPQLNSAIAHYIGAFPTPGDFFDGLISDVYFIDGIALTPSSFGEIDSTTGTWNPKQYIGNYNINGCHLTFQDNSGATATTIGKDYSGHDNNFTPINVSVTSGATNDSFIDTPTNYDDGSTGRGNYWGMNPLDGNGSGISFLDSNLRMNWTSNANRNCFSIPFAKTGKLYFETLQTLGVNSDVVQGFILSSFASGTASAVTDSSFNGYTYAGRKFTNGSGVDGGTTLTVNSNVACWAIDFDAGKIWLGKDGVWFGSGNPSSGTNPLWTFTAGTELKFASIIYNGEVVLNFGQRPFANTPPTSFKASNTQNLADPVIPNPKKQFDISLYIGTGVAQNIVNSGAMQPDFIWFKGRSVSSSNNVYDSVRGTTKSMRTQTSEAEVTADITQDLTAFNSNGFSLGTPFNTSPNPSGASIVAWQWKKGAVPGLDIVAYTGTGAVLNISHALGVIPKFVMYKLRSVANDWVVYHSSIGAGSYLILDSTAAASAVAAVFNSTAPSSSQLTLGTNGTVNTSGATGIAFAWAEVPGFSKFGSYVGNGSTDGPFIYCAFRPKYIMFKRIDSDESWAIFDSARDPFNVVGNLLSANSSGAESASGPRLDLVSNGFKIRIGGASTPNISGATYIYAAFADQPFKTARAR